MSKKSITIIIPVYDDLAGLKDTLVSLNGQILPEKKDYEIMVAADGGDEQVTAFCREQGIEVIEIEPNQGSYHARNEAAKIARTPYIAFIDAGIIADKNWLSNGLMYLHDYDYVAGDVRMTSDHIPDIAAFHDYLTAFPMKAYFERIGFGGAGNLFIKRTLFETIGYFDDRLRSCGDLEFGTRVKSDSAIKRFFAEDCIGYHKPRNHREKVVKMKRVKAGQNMLIALYGDRFSFLKKKKGIIRKLRGLLPRPWSAVNKIYRDNEQFSKMQLYIYMYRIKLIKTFNDL